MKNKYALIISFCLILLGGLASSCTEEEVKPANVTGMDDWEKHNV